MSVTHSEPLPFFHKNLDIHLTKFYEVLNRPAIFLTIVELTTGCTPKCMTSAECYQADRHGGYYIIRTSAAINPTIEQAFETQGRQVKRLQGKGLKGLNTARDTAYDLTVRWQYKPGSYRLIAFWDRKTKKTGYLITHLSRDTFSLNKILELYGLRWQIELFFKELKSFCHLKTFNTQDKDIAQSLVWASMLSLLLKRLVAWSVACHYQVVISTQKVAASGSLWVSELLHALLEENDKTLRQTLKRIGQFLAVNARRANIKRDKDTLFVQLLTGKKSAAAI